MSARQRRRMEARMARCEACGDLLPPTDQPDQGEDEAVKHGGAWMHWRCVPEAERHEVAGVVHPKPTREKRPSGLEWTERPVPPQTWAGRHKPAAISAWTCGPIFVLSELSLAMEAPDGDGTTPQWLVTISAKGGRPTPKQTRKALRAFGMTEAEEDNHAPGITRGFFLVVDPARRVACQCKTDETVVVEPDGYQWSRDDSGKPCAGCELGAAVGIPCPQHGR